MMHLRKFGIEAQLIDKDEAPIVHEAAFSVPADLKFLEGHFPNNPVLPAFATLEISLALGRDLGLLPLTAKSIPNAKFLAIIKPDTKLRVLVRNYKTSIDFEWLIEENSGWKKAGEVSVAI